MMKIKTSITVERNGWIWIIEPQEGCSNGVDLVYQETDRPNESTVRHCLGDVGDAEALAEAIQFYVKLYREYNK